MLETWDALRLLLMADAPVLALVSTRIYPNIIEQTATLPAVAYRRVDETHEEILSAPGSAGLKTERYRLITAASGTGAYISAMAVDDAIFLALEGFMGTVSDAGSPSETLFINSIFKKSSFDFYDDTTKTHQVISEYEIASEHVQSS